MKVSLIYPSRSRPDQCHTTLENWINKAGSIDFEIILSLDDDDIRLSDYQKMLFDWFTENKNPVITYMVRPNKSTVEAVNNAAKIAQGEILIVMSDDFDCPADWFNKIIKAIGKRTDFVMKVNDGGTQDRIITLPIMDRVYYERFGYIYHPSYKHLWADTELSEVAYWMKKVIVRNDLVFFHKHYSVLKTIPDATYLKNELTYEEGKKNYKERQRRKFDLA